MWRAMITGSQSRALQASIFSVLLIVGAYGAATWDGIHLPTAEASTQSELLQAIAQKDTDQDGLPDWEESLYGTSPSVRDSRELGMTDGEAVKKGLIVPQAVTATPSEATDESAPLTLTDIFSRELFLSYMSLKYQKDGEALTQEEMERLIKTVFVRLQGANLVAVTRDEADIETTVSSKEAMSVYAASAEAVFLAHEPGDAGKNELEHLKAAVAGDAAAYARAAARGQSYRDIAAGLMALPVPSTLVDEHLALVNALERLGTIVGEIAGIPTDPLGGILALRLHEDADRNVDAVFARIRIVYAASGITLNAGTSGARFVAAMKNP